MNGVIYLYSLSSMSWIWASLPFTWATLFEHIVTFALLPSNTFVYVFWRQFCTQFSSFTMHAAKPRRLLAPFDSSWLAQIVGKPWRIIIEMELEVVWMNGYALDAAASRWGPVVIFVCVKWTLQLSIPCLSDQCIRLLYRPNALCQEPKTLLRHVSVKIYHPWLWQFFFLQKHVAVVSVIYMCLLRCIGLV
jgi:hypothetical protein